MTRARNREFSRPHKGVAQAILRWLTQRGSVAIPKSVRADRIAENFDVIDFELSPEDMAAIATLDRHESSFFQTGAEERWQEPTFLPLSRTPSDPGANG